MSSSSQQPKIVPDFDSTIPDDKKIAWLDKPTNDDKIVFTNGATRANVIDQFVCYMCLCGKHPAPVFVLDQPYVVVACAGDDKMIWLPKDKDMAKFKLALTTPQFK